ncbi:MAG: hypothetical protein O7E52_12060, partial [Candidatus Poribacteria bacterium]|nr:hypothetical protein [Candidatus Poribacteria bacterium]
IERIIAELDIDNEDIRTRKSWAISIDFDSETQRLTLDVKDAPIEQVVRKLSIQTGIDVLILGENGGGTVTPRRARQTRGTSGTGQQNQQTPQQPRRNLSPAALRNTVTLRLADAALEEVLTALFKGQIQEEPFYDSQEVHLLTTDEYLYPCCPPAMPSRKVGGHPKR